MLILAGQAAGSELDPSCVLSLAKRRTARMALAGGRNVMVSGHLPRHFTRCMHVAGMHQEHRRQGHFCPNHHDHKERRRNGPLQHADLVSQTRNSLDVTTITLGDDANE